MFARPTRELVGNDTDRPGIVGNATLGPEYRYLTRWGLYFGGSLGVGATGTFDDIGVPHCSEALSPERCLRALDVAQGRDAEYRISWGGAATAVVGYEARFAPWFSMSIEAYMGYQRGFDDTEDRMDQRSAGIAVGFGM
jgi:hypothetical protein